MSWTNSTLFPATMGFRVLIPRYPWAVTVREDGVTGWSPAAIFHSPPEVITRRSPRGTTARMAFTCRAAMVAVMASLSRASACQKFS